MWEEFSSNFDFWNREGYKSRDNLIWNWYRSIYLCINLDNRWNIYYNIRDECKWYSVCWCEKFEILKIDSVRHF